MLTKRKFHYHFRFSITSYNYKKLEEMIELCLKYNLKRTFFSQLTPYGRALKNRDLLLSENAKKYVIKTLVNLKTKYNKRIDFSVPEIFESTGCPIFSDMSEIYIKPRIDSNGYVYLCQLFQGRELAVGNIDSFKFEDLFTCKAYSELATKIENRKNNPDCKNCQIWFICHGGCPAVAFSIKQPFDGFCEARQYRFNLFLKEMADRITV